MKDAAQAGKFGSNDPAEMGAETAPSVLCDALRTPSRIVPVTFP